MNDQGPHQSEASPGLQMKKNSIGGVDYTIDVRAEKPNRERQESQEPRRGRKLLPPQGQKQREEVVFPGAGSWGQARIWVGTFWGGWDQRPSTVSVGDTTGHTGTGGEMGGERP